MHPRVLPHIVGYQPWDLLMTHVKEEAALCAIDLLPEEGEQFRVCESHRALGQIYHSKGNTEKAIDHFEVAFGIASPFD